MSGMTLNSSLAALSAAPEPARSVAIPPPGAVSFAAVLSGIDTPDAAANGKAFQTGGAPVSKDTPTEGEGKPPGGANDPFSIEAGLAALGYGPFDGADGAASPAASAASSQPTPRASAFPRNEIALSSPSSPGAAAPPEARSPEPSASNEVPPDAAMNDAASIETGLAALDYSPPEAPRAAPPPGRVSGKAPSPGPNGTAPSQKPTAAPRIQPAPSPGILSNPTAPAVISANSPVSSADQIVTDGPLTSGAPLSIEAKLATLGYGSSGPTPDAPVPTRPAREAAPSGRTPNADATPSRGVATWRAAPRSAALPAMPAARVSTAARQRWSAVGAPNISPSPTRSPAKSALDVSTSDASAGSLSPGLILQGSAPGIATQAVASKALADSPRVRSDDSGVSVPTLKAPAVTRSPIGSNTATDPRLAALSAPTSASPIPATSGDPVSAAAAFNPLTADPALGLQSLQSRTHLAMTNAVPIRTGATEKRAAPSTGASTAAAPAPSAMLVASNAEPGGGEAANSRSGARPSLASARAAVAPSAPPVSPDAPLATAAAGLDPKASASTTLPLNRLADFVAEQASSLNARVSPSPSSPTSSASAPQAVKELEISLDPANLGAVSVKMRLANGKLSIVIGVANSSTLAAIENERGAISARLGSTQQPLETLVIRSQATSSEPSPSATGGNDASDSGNSRNARSNDDSSGAQRGESGFARGRNDRSPGSGPQNFTPSTSGGGTGALLV